MSGKAIPGWTSVIITTIILGSTQLIVIFGEYLGRLYIETKCRPLFIIDRVISQRKLDSQMEYLNPKIVKVENPSS
jgi:hypothetical protein